jgi:hypothetical protein
MHAQTKLGQLRCRPLTPEQIAAKFRLKLLDRPRQRRLGDVAFVGGAREVQHACHGQEVAHLVHFHDRAPDGSNPKSTRYCAARRPEPR